MRQRKIPDLEKKLSAYQDLLVDLTAWTKASPSAFSSPERGAAPAASPRDAAGPGHDAGADSSGARPAGPGHDAGADSSGARPAGPGHDAGADPSGARPAGPGNGAGTDPSGARPAAGPRRRAGDLAAPAELRGRWRSLFPGAPADAPLYVEIGCGKGKFITGMASQEPEACFLAIEGNWSVGWYALRRIRAAGLTNVRVLLGYTDDLRALFAPGELTGLYLNFSDPWPKARHYKRRLTYGPRLASYVEVIQSGGRLEFRTDNRPLFDWSVDQVQDQEALTLEDVTTDLHGRERSGAFVTTEYEDKFAGQGLKICFLRARVLKERRSGPIMKALDEKEDEMDEFIMAQANGRTVPAEDMIFGISSRAKAMIAEKGADQVINATIGMLLDDDGKLLVLSSVDKVFHELKPEDYAPYAPIGGTPGYKKAVLQAAFHGVEMKCYPRVVASAGGTGAIRLAVGNYSKVGDQILTTDWHWGPYGKVASEIGRTVTTFQLFDEAGKFNTADFRKRVMELLEDQDQLLIILNTPAQNPTGYCLTDEEWREALGVLSGLPETKRVGLLVDTAYIDFAGDEDTVRTFLPQLTELPENVLPMLAYSFSKTFTIYGMRIGALVGICPTEAIADEFVRVGEFSARASWSNAPKASQSLIEKIFADPETLKKVSEERKEIRDMLLARGEAFEAAARKAGLPILPFDGGFFAVIPCEDPKALGEKLEKKGIFMVPFGRGLRVSLASTPLKRCEEIPAKVLEAMGK